MGGVGGGGVVTLPTQLQQNLCMQTHNKQNRMQKTETRVHKITNVTVFIWLLDLMIFKRENPLLGLLEGVGPQNWFSRIKIIASRAI